MEIIIVKVKYYKVININLNSITMKIPKYQLLYNKITYHYSKSIITH